MQRLSGRHIKYIMRRRLRLLHFQWQRFCRSHRYRRVWPRRLANLHRNLRGRTVLNIALVLTALYFFAGWFQPSVQPPPQSRQIVVWRADLKQAVRMDIEDYLKGVVAAEMPASFAMEALKAQAVAARTYTIHAMLDEDGVAGHPGADVTTDYTVSKGQAFKSESTLRQELSFLEYYWRWRKINKAVDETVGIVLTYKDKPIDAVFHSDSGGHTEDSENYWNSALPYLRSVVDEYALPEPVVEVRTLSAVQDAARNAAAGTIPAMAGESVTSSTVVILERYESGRVKWMQVGGRVVSGREMRDKLNLRSNMFDVTVDGQSVKFTVRGYGHGIGMPQYGADGMAKKGASYKEILLKYYTGVELVHWY